MKKLARLTIFFSLCFVVLFSMAVLLMVVSSWIDMARSIPLEPVSGKDFAEIVWEALPIAIYLSILLTLSYSARKNMPLPLTFLCIFILGWGFSLGASLGINRIDALKPVLRPVSPIQGAPGLILTRSGAATILLKESSEILGPRVVSIPGRPLIYQEVPLGPNNSILRLPALSFGDDTPWFVRSLGIDFSICAAEMKSRFSDSFLSFIAYAFALILLLGSLRFLLGLSQWPLANLFLGALVFRGILALDIFLNTREINVLAGHYFSARVPEMLITPIIFCALGILVLFYTLLVRLAKYPGQRPSGPRLKRRRDD